MTVLAGSWRPTVRDNPVVVLVFGISSIVNGALAVAVAAGWVDVSSDDLAKIAGGVNVMVAALSSILARSKVSPVNLDC